MVVSVAPVSVPSAARRPSLHHISPSVAGTLSARACGLGVSCCLAVPPRGRHPGVHRSWLAHRARVSRRAAPIAHFPSAARLPPAVVERLRAFIGASNTETFEAFGAALMCSSLVSGQPALPDPPKEALTRGRTPSCATQVLSLITMFTRYHNMLCDRLTAARPNATAESHFWEARKVVIALLQKARPRVPPAQQVGGTHRKSEDKSGVH